MTTLATVGLGDFIPISSIEKLYGIFIILFGVATYSFIAGQYQSMLQKIIGLSSEGEEDSELESFFATFDHFNGNLPSNSEIKNQIQSFLKYKWEND